METLSILPEWNDDEEPTVTEQMRAFIPALLHFGCELSELPRGLIKLGLDKAKDMPLYFLSTRKSQKNNRSGNNRHP